VVVVAVAAGTVVDEVGGVNATSTSTRGMLVNHDITRTHGTARTAGAEILGEGDITNPRTTTLPQLKPGAVRTGDTHHGATIRTNNRVGTGDHLSRRTTHGLRGNHLPMEVIGEGTIPDTTVRTAAGRMGTMGREEALLPIEEVHRTAVVDMGIKGVKEEGGMGTVVTAVDTINPRKTTVTVGEVAVAIPPEEAINQVEAISQVETIDQAEGISLVDHIVPVSSLMETKEDTIKEVAVVEEDIDHTDARACTRVSLRFASSTFLSYF